jgi:hypothetical protein
LYHSFSTEIEDPKLENTTVNPNYGSAIIFELHEIEEKIENQIKKNYFLKIFYKKNYGTENFKLLKLKNFQNLNLNFGVNFFDFKKKIKENNSIYSTLKWCNNCLNFRSPICSKKRIKFFKANFVKIFLYLFLALITILIFYFKKK